MYDWSTVISIGPVNPPDNVIVIAYGAATPPRPTCAYRTLASTGPSDNLTVRVWTPSTPNRPATTKMAVIVRINRRQTTPRRWAAWPSSSGAA